MPHASWVETALDYVQCGWLLTPLHGYRGDGCTCGAPICPGPAAHPRHEDWLGAATDSPEGILAWGARWEHGRAGLVLGPDSGVVALEVEGGAGALWLRTLARGGRRLPETSEVRDRRTGRATFLFRYPAGVPLRRAYAAGPGLRLVCRAAYLPLPEHHLRTPACRDYWHLQLERRELPEVPSWLLAEAGVAGSGLPALHVPGSADPSRSPAPDRPPTPQPVHPPPAAVEPADRAWASAAEEQAWMVEPWVPAGGLTLLTGAPKLAGKTTLALSVIRAVLTGEPLAGVSRPPGRPPPVLVLTEQTPESFIRLMRKAGLRREDASAIHVLFASRTGTADFGEVVGIVARALRELGPALVVFDSLERFVGTLDPRQAVRVLEPLMVAGAGVLGIYPTPRGEGLREAVSVLGPLASAADVVLALREVPGAPPTTRLLEAVGRLDGVPAHTLLDCAQGAYRTADAASLLGRLAAQRSHTAA